VAPAAIEVPATAFPPGSDGFFLGSSEGAKTAALDEIAHELSRQGVLPKDARPEQLAALVHQVSTELRESEQSLRALGYTSSGAKAVDDSQYLARLMSGRSDGSQKALFDLFSRRVQDKTFVLKDGVWVDQSLPEPLPAARTAVEAFSSEYFALLAARPALAPYLALSARLIVQLGGEVYEITPPRAGG
jgi:hypothetical protein